MRPPAINLTFGEKEFTIRPLTIKQLMEIESLGVEIHEGKITMRNSEFAVRVIGIALSRDYPDVKIDEDLESTPEHLGETVDKILALAGMKKVPSGE